MHSGFLDNNSQFLEEKEAAIALPEENLLN